MGKECSSCGGCDELVQIETECSEQQTFQHIQTPKIDLKGVPVVVLAFTEKGERVSIIGTNVPEDKLTVLCGTALQIANRPGGFSEIPECLNELISLGFEEDILKVIKPSDN